MERIKKFIRTALLGGITVILPIIILIFVFTWVFNFISGLIQPFTNLLISQSDLNKIVADVIVISIILTGCFFVGVFVKTSLGRWIFHAFESNFLVPAPGYTLIKETVLQLLGSKKSPFSTVALAKVFGNDTMLTCFVTDEHAGLCTIFVPTGPNPTSGFIYHVEKERVIPVDVSVEDAMRSVLSCGAGSSKLIEEYRKKTSA